MWPLQSKTLILSAMAKDLQGLFLRGMFFSITKALDGKKGVTVVPILVNQ
jgi:hypothetical protein